MGIDRTLIERRLDELYAIGAEPDGGAYRPLYGPAWATAVERVERWLKDAGLKTRRDAVGNLWGRVEGTDKGMSIVTGSHIDTVRRGGRLDGALGIVAGLTAVELHIEQGAVLESANRPLAIVSAIVGTAHLEVTVTGRPDHAGTTPMDMRRDALAGAAAMVQAVESIARSLGQPAVATVGKLAVEPDQINVVPGRVVFTMDLRHTELSGRRALEERVRSVCDTIAAERRVGLAMRTLQDKPPVAMHPEVRALLARAAQDCGVQATEMVSGAGHDAQILAARCKVGMLFVPSIGGRSHCPEEATNPEHLRLGTEVLARSLELLAYSSGEQ